MSTRFKWYRVKCPRGRDLLGAIKSNPFRKESEHGFLRITTEESTADYRFVWKSEVVVASVDQDSSPQYERVQTINFIDFSFLARDGATFLRLVNSGRDVRSLLKALEEMVGFGFTAQKLAFDKHPPKTIFKNAEVVKLVSTKLVGAVVGQDLLARIELASKQGMSLQDIKILSNLDYRVESASYEMQYKGVRGSFSYSSNGTVKLGGQLAPRLLTLLESDLLKARK